jgi:hypothetical protein
VSEDHCGNCYYHSFYGLKNWCFHPGHPYEIRKFGRKCDDYSDMFRKEPVKVKRLTIEELGSIVKAGE